MLILFIVLSDIAFWVEFFFAVAQGNKTATILSTFGIVMMTCCQMVVYNNISKME